nr:BamA/TamA family outer membrane protein [Candidatus Babeliales bacterium]
AWYTPLINEHDLILCLHGNFGWVHPFCGKDVPWKNLYHVGGPTSIRGYTYGQVGPTWKEDSLGATKAFFLNVEFIVPLSSDLNTRGVIFYDGGAGWDTPYLNEFSAAARDVGVSFEKDFSNNNFFYRHSVGIGVRIKSPTPLQVDFGIKLNPSKKFKDHLTEMHLSMEHSF